ncbi:MAG TPA: TetR/AcrR family transcriptional regulator [Candidatus Limnocylindrales bacterium]
MSAATRLTAEERRDEIVAAASIEFAETGYAGTSTDAIARRSGVSQPYLFQLFGTKKELFTAAVRDCFDRTRRTFEQSGKTARLAGLPPAGILEAMGHAYVELLLADRGVLRLQLQAYAACGDPDIQTFVRDNYGLLWQTVANISGADPEAVRKWFADGMLINVIASISNASTMEDFFHLLMGGAFAPC